MIPKWCNVNILKLNDIKELAQNFLNSPRIEKNDSGLYLIYDYEKDDGEYSEKTIFFKNVKGFRQILENNITVDMIKAYNSVAVVIDSEWLTDEMYLQGFKHFIIYFEEYGAYEIIAKEFQCMTT